MLKSLFLYLEEVKDLPQIFLRNILISAMNGEVEYGLKHPSKMK